MRLTLLAVLLALTPLKAVADDLGKQNYFAPWTDEQVGVTANYIGGLMDPTDAASESLWHVAKKCLYATRIKYTRYDYTTYPHVQPPDTVLKHFLLCAHDEGYEFKPDSGISVAN